MSVPATLGPRRATRLWAWLAACLLLLSSTHLLAYDVTVAKDGTGNYTTISAAVAAAPTARTTVYTIYIKDGIYSEKVTVPSTKPFLQFIGQSVANTILTWNDNALTPDGAGGTLGTGGSGSIVVRATDFSALNMTFVNSFGDGSQAVAVSLYADRAAFKNCRFQGNQDTLLTFESGGAVSRHYFRDCYIDGNVDFIFGNAIAIFDNCTIYAKTRVINPATSYITAANTQSTQNYGYLFRNARIPSNNGTTLYYLGRPWQNSTGFSTAAGTLANNKVIFMKTKVGVNEIQPAGWVVWDSGTDVSKITFGEYKTRYFNGNNVNVSQRVSWSQQLTPADTVQYTKANLFGTGTGTGSPGGTAVASAWDPVSLDASFGTYRAPDIAVSNLQATKGSSQTSLQWNISWAMSGIQYALQRSSDNVNFSTINTQTAATDSLYNFAATDALPAAGTAYYYRVVASKSGLATHTTPSIQVSSIPTITTSTASLSAFTQYGTGTSAVQTYTVSGANLTDNITITPPSGFEVSANAGTNWYTSSAPLVLTQSNNAVASTTISVRLNAAATGSYGGNIAHTSTGASTVNVAVTGNRVTGTAPQSDPLQWWPLIRSSSDSTQVRSAQLQATQPTLKALYLSNGTQVATIPAYSTKFGQADGPSADGSGTWSAVGGTLKRNYYEQFQVKTTATGAVRVDSLVLAQAFYNTSSSTKLAVVYSRSNFVSDSSDVSAGTGPGTSSTAYGAFTAPIALSNQTGGPTNVYHLALNGSTGVSLTGGQTLTIRIYNSCSSSSAGRYALTKNVIVKGAATAAACNAAFSYAANAYCQSGTNPTPTITGTTGGTFSSTSGLTIDATTGTITLSSSTAGTYVVTYTASAGCSSTQNVTVTTPPTANIGYSAASYCTTTTGTVALGIGTGSTRGTITVNPTTGLTIAADGTITPSTSTPGTYFITNTVAASGGCAAVTGGTTVSIVAPATAGFSYAGTPYCASGTTNPTVTLASGATAGTFTSTTGLTINASTGAITLSSSTPGTYTVTNTVAASGGCAAVSSTATVTINRALVATFSYSGSPYCSLSSSTPAPTLAAGATLGTFTASPTGLDLNAATGEVLLASSAPGTYTVTNTLAASGGCSATSATAQLVITRQPTATFGYVAPASGCAGSTGTATPALNPNATAGTFTATPTGLTINATTGVITLGSSAAGTYTITNTVAGSGGCGGATATATFTVNAVPTTPTLTTTGSAATGITLSSSATTGNQFYLNGVAISGATAQTYLVNSGTKNGSYTVVVTGAGGCTSAASAAVTVTVTATTAAQATAGLTLYPNPTPDGRLTLELSGFGPEAVSLTVRNALGQAVYGGTVPAGTTTHALDLGSLSSGVYLLQGRTASGQQVVRRLVVQ